MLQIEFKFSNLFFLIYFISFIFVLALIVQLNYGQFDGPMFYLFGGEIPSRIANGDLWLLVTANFFHTDILHFLFNFIALKRIGETVEQFYEGSLLFTTFIFSGIGGTLLSYLICLITNTEIYSLGASAGIFGLIGLLVGGSLKKYRYGMELPFGIRDILPFVLIAFLFGFIPGNVNNWAHLGGLITGIIFGLTFSNSYNKDHPLEKRTKDIMYYVSIFILIVSYVALLLNFFNIVTN